MPRPAVLQLNESGSWRNVISFDVDTAGYDAMEIAAAELVLAAGGQGTRTTLRTVNATQQPPVVLRRWDARKGWRDAE